jgi:hypothetical protein
MAQPVANTCKSWQFLHPRIRALQEIALQFVTRFFDQCELASWGCSFSGLQRRQ